MKKYVDLHRKEQAHESGDWVYLRLQPYRQNSLKNGKSFKLSPHYFGPYQVVEKIGTVAYRVQLPDEA